ncbi:MAG: hypothetical protein ACREBU_09310 [Nitrososphaera sp.]
MTHRLRRGSISDVEYESDRLPRELESTQMGRCYMFWDSFVEFFKGEQTRDDDSMPDAFSNFLDGMERDTIVMYRDAHWEMFNKFNEYLNSIPE